MIDIGRALKSERIMKSLTGMQPAEFCGILPVFEDILNLEARQKERERAPGAGAPHTLETSAEKLFYTLFYVRCYPAFDAAAFFSGVDRAQTCRWTHTFLPFLEKTPGKKPVLPQRQIRSAGEFIRLFPEVTEVFPDGTERPVNRSIRPEKQAAEYSGKKKRRTRKNIIVTDSEKRILILTETVPGSVHDYRGLKDSGLAGALPAGTTVNADPGFQGIRKDFPHLNAVIPHRKPRGGDLTPEQKAENKRISSHRVTAENAVCGIKRMKSLTDINRNRTENFDDRLINIGCGIWNYHLKAA